MSDTGGLEYLEEDDSDKENVDPDVMPLDPTGMCQQLADHKAIHLAIIRDLFPDGHIGVGCPDEDESEGEKGPNNISQEYWNRCGMTVEGRTMVRTAEHTITHHYGTI